jgi:N-acetylmuramoyl-L-alanine amidase
MRSQRLMRSLLAFASLVAVASACSRTEPGADAGLGDEVARGRALLEPRAELPVRPEVIALAQSIEGAALKEGAGGRAAELHALAAALHERLFRLEHREQDAKEAVDLYVEASRDLSLPGACEAAVRGAKLAGELAGDATVTYTELYRVTRRVAGAGEEVAAKATTCGRLVEEPLAQLAPFRPDAQVLEAVDHGLAAAGVVPVALTDASPARVSVAPRVTRLEHWVEGDAARVVVHVDRPAHFRVGDVARGTQKGARTYVDLDGVELDGAARETALGGIVPRLLAEATTTGARVSLDLDGPAYRRVFHLLEPYRIVIDIARHPPGASTDRRVSRVVIDPGHGGNDPGAIGPTGMKEKDVTLAIAHKVAPVLARLGIEVALTRDDDRYVTLEERTARANAFGADVFVSIHCNAAENKTRRGIETYVLDTTTSDMAGRVAARENGASQAASAEVAQLLASMRLADQASRSTRLAELLQKAGMASLGTRYRDLPDGGIHRAGFYVLVGARMPAVVFETSYISNAIDEQHLGRTDYQQGLADAVANAIKAYREGR